MNETEIQNLVLYKDPLMLVLNKPAGIAVHKGPSGQPALEDYFDELKFGLPEAPNLAHRLDRDTSGCLVLGRNRKALAKLGKLFSGDGKIEKKYWAICHKAPPENEGVINAPLLKINTKRGWRIVVDPKGQPSVTEYTVLAKTADFSLIEARPKTGRTHQIRIHLKSIGCPIIGDPFYGFHRQDNEIIKSGIMENDEVTLNLHARSIKIPLYPNREAIFVEAPPPPKFIEKLKAIKLDEFLKKTV